MITSAKLDEIASQLRTMESAIHDFAAAWYEGIVDADAAMSNVESNWGGPRPKQDQDAANAYLDQVRDLGGQLGALAGAIGSFATEAETCSSDIAPHENSTSDDPDAVQAAQEGCMAVNVAWVGACARHALSIGDAWSPVKKALDATATGFSEPVPEGTAYYGFVAQFAVEEDLELDEIDPTGKLSSAVSTAQNEVINHPLGWLVLAAIETANDDQSITDADGDLSGGDIDDALDPGRIEELIREASEKYGLNLSDEEIAELVALAVNTTALTSASGDATRLAEATERANRGPRPATSDELNEALADGAPDFLEQASGLIDESELQVRVTEVEGHRVFVFTDGVSTAVFSEQFEGTVMVIDAVPTDATVLARQVGEAAKGFGTAMDVVQLGEAAVAGWNAAEGEPLPERAMSVVAASAPVAAEIAVDSGAATAGAAACTPGGPILMAACAFSAPIFVDFVASLGNPGAPASFCVDGDFDITEATSMGMFHTSEEVVGCGPTGSTVPE